jgi:hypothetical protein
MAVVAGTIDRALDQASALIRRIASEQRYSFDEAESRPPAQLSLTKAVSAFSWGSKLLVALSQHGGSTQVMITTTERFAITDWGRGKRACKRLLDGVGATLTS